MTTVGNASESPGQNTRPTSCIVKSAMESKICEFLEYNPLTGDLIWKAKAAYQTVIGANAGGINGEGYIGVWIGGVNFLAHRIAWFLYYGEWPEEEIDHRNRIKTDNRITNLRDVTTFTNHQNRSDNKSGAVGVTWHKATNKWHSQIYKAGKRIHLGLFEEFVDAVIARKEAESLYHPEFTS